MPIGPNAVRNRVYADFLMPSRLGAYERLLESALGAGYELTSIERFWKLILAGAVDPDRRYLLLRHDVDTDPATAAAMWDIDRRLGVLPSYFFRLSTLDVGLMQAIGTGGGDASYHFEELATVAKRRRIRTSGEVAGLFPEARDLFLRNLERLRAMTRLPMRVVASHGDFVNRRLGVQNLAILADPEFRQKAGVELETNDEAFMTHVSSRHSDTHHPRFWIPDDALSPIRRGDPTAAMKAGNRVVYLLIHPRHWRVNRSFNARDDLTRLWEGITYRLPARQATRIR